MTKPRVIVTGGTGFIGRPLSLRLIQKGYDVVCLTRNASIAERYGGNGVNFVEWDGKTAEGWNGFAEEARAVINLAGESIGSGRWSGARKQRIIQSRINAGKAITQAVESVKKKPEVLIQASAIGIYGNRGDETLDESSGPGEGFLAQVAKDWEDSTRSVEALGIRRVIIRSGIVLGSDGGVLARLLLPYRFFVGGPIGRGKQWMSWIHIADEVGCILFLMEHTDLSGIFNLISPHPHQNQGLSRELGKQLHKPSWLPVPSFFLRLFLGKMADETILTSQRVLPVRLEDAGYPFVYPDLRAALADLLISG